MARIYTRSGDMGETGLFGGGQAPEEDDLRLEACGAVDELNASIGAARALGQDAEIDKVLATVQHDLFHVGSDLATPLDAPTTAGGSSITRISEERVTRLEASIDVFEAGLTPLRQFVLPGGSATAAGLHVSRTVCRRAERRCVTLMRSRDTATINLVVLKYLNRLSDLLFVLARAANQRAGVQDVHWDPEV